MNRIAKYFIFAAIILTFSGLRPAYAEKIGYVDVAKVFDEYEKTKTNDKTLAEEGKKKQTERDNKVQEIRRLKDELALLADKNKEQKQQAIDDKIKSLQDFDQGARSDLGKKRDEAVKEILKDIDAVIAEYGTKKGFDFIFNERALLFHGDKFDVTADILAELNGRYKAKGGKGSGK